MYLPDDRVPHTQDTMQQRSLQVKVRSCSVVDATSSPILAADRTALPTMEQLGTYAQTTIERCRTEAGSTMGYMF